MALSILFLKIQQYVLYFDVDLMLKQFKPQHQYLFLEKVSPIFPWACWPSALSAQQCSVPSAGYSQTQPQFSEALWGGHLSNKWYVILRIWLQKASKRLTDSFLELLCVWNRHGEDQNPMARTETNVTSCLFFSFTYNCLFLNQWNRWLRNQLWRWLAR